MTNWRRILKIGGALLLAWVACVGIAGAVVQSRVPVQLPLQRPLGAQGPDYVTFNGTWRIEGERDAYPLQTSEIECRRELGLCIDATARVTDGVLRVILETYTIRTWTRTQLIFVNDVPACVSYTYTADLVTGHVSGLRQRKPPMVGPESLCAGLESELRLRLDDGLTLWQSLTQEAMPWFGRLALFSLR